MELPIESWCTAAASDVNLEAVLVGGDKVFEISSNPFYTIGRSSSQSMIQIEHASLSRRHALIMFRKDDLYPRFFITDLATGKGKLN